MGRHESYYCVKMVEIRMNIFSFLLFFDSNVVIKRKKTLNNGDKKFGI